MVAAGHPTSFQTTERTTPRASPSVGHGLWVVMTCSCEPTDHSKRTSWRVLLLVGEAVQVCGEQGTMGSPLYLLLDFAVNLNLCYV